MLPVDQSMYRMSLSVAGGSTRPWKKEERRVSSSQNEESSSSQNEDMIATGGAGGKQDVSVARLLFATFRSTPERSVAFECALQFPTILFIPTSRRRHCEGGVA